MHAYTPHRKLLSDDPRFEVPAVIPELSTKRVLTSDLVHGMPLDQCARLPQEAKNDVRSCQLGSHDHHTTTVTTADSREGPELVSERAV